MIHLMNELVPLVLPEVDDKFLISRLSRFYCLLLVFLASDGDWSITNSFRKPYLTAFHVVLTVIRCHYDVISLERRGIICHVTRRRRYLSGNHVTG